MAQTFIWKPSTINSWKGGIAFLADQSGPRTPPTITGPDGKTYTGRYVNTNEGRHQWVFPKELASMQGLKVNYGGQTGTIGNAAMSYEGSGLADWKERQKGSLGDPGSMGGGAPAGFVPGQIGFGFFPGYQNFPSPTFANFGSIQTAPFKYTDPFEFAKKFGDLSRSELAKGNEFARNMSLDQLNTELEGLKSFVPAASALKRSELSADNIFNQEQRDKQFDSTLPGAREALASQTDRAEVYASGRVPDEITDRALELTARSRAADRTTASGFRGAAADKISDLFSAEQRLGFAQYGEQLLAGSIGNRANLLLAPTSYSDAGAQVRVNPSVSGAQLQANNLGMISSLSNLSAGQAFSGEIGQQQFATNLEQGTRQFNAQGEFQESTFNAGVDNQFKLGKFQYDVGYAGAVAGAAQTNMNTGVALDQQAQANQASLQQQQANQQANTIGAIGSAIGAVAGAVGTAATVGSSAPVTVGGASYPSGASQGGGQGSIVVPAGQAIPAGYESTGNVSSTGGVIARPTRRPSSSRPPSDGGQSNEDFDTSSPPSPSGDEGTDPSTIPPDAPQPPLDGQLPPETDDGGGLEAGDTFARSRPATAASFTNPADIQSFENDTGIKLKREEVPHVQSQSKAVLSDAGIHDAPKQNTRNIGVDNSGAPLYGDTFKMNSNDPAAGSQYVNHFTELLAPTGALDKKDVSALQQIGQVASDANFIAKLEALRQKGDTAGFINALAQKYKTPIINTVSKDPQNRAGLGATFTAYNLYQNWDRMSTAQKGLGLASLGLQTFKFSTGEDLALKPIIKPTQNTVGLTVGQALGLFQQGVNVYGLVNNWDDLNNLQRVAYGTQSAAAISRTARQMGLLGQGTTGAAVATTPQQLSSMGYSAAPTYGVGAITAANGAEVPRGYTVVANTEGQQIAVPEANVSTADTIIGGSQVAIGANSVYQNWGEGGTEGAVNGAVGGSQMVAGLSQMGQTNPYLLGGIVAASMLGGMIERDSPASTALGVGTAGAAGYGAATAGGAGAAEAAGGMGSTAGNVALGAGAAAQQYGIMSSDMSDEDKAKYGRRGAEDTAGTYFSGGLWAVAQYADRKFLGGQTDKLRDRAEGITPLAGTLDKYTGKVIGEVMGGKNKAQMGRDTIRDDVFRKSGLANDKYQVTLASGELADIGVDGKGERREIAHPELLTSEHKKGKVKKLHSYDIDYTNDLDFAAGMGGITLSRLLSGGKATNVDQMGGQLGNASLKDVGYGKEMTPENFEKMARNQRAFFAQSGIKSKQEANQLINTAYAQKRLTAADMVSAQQAISMIFDRGGYSLAQKLMAGRHRGIEVVAAGQAEFKPTVTGGFGSGNKPGTSRPSSPTANQVTGTEGNGLPPGIDMSNIVPYRGPGPKRGTMRRSREDILAQNRQRYSGASA